MQEKSESKKRKILYVVLILSLLINFAFVLKFLDIYIDYTTSQAEDSYDVDREEEARQLCNSLETKERLRVACFVCYMSGGHWDSGNNLCNNNIGDGDAL
jgi:hypothetical protein